jgi:hypothetical protein
MTLYSLQHATEIIDGAAYTIHANHLIDNFNALSSDINDRLSTTTANTQVVSGPVTFNGAVTLAGGVAGTINFASLPTSAQTTPTASNNLATKLYVDSASRATPLNTMYGASPVYVNAATITIGPFSCLDSTGAVFINNIGTTTVTTNTTGAANGILTSSTLAGTVAGTKGSGTITGTGTTATTDLKVGDIVTIATVTTGNLSGTVSITSGTTVVTGSSTTFTQDFVPGDTINFAGGASGIVDNVASDTSMTLTANYTGPTLSGVTYTASGPQIRKVAAISSNTSFTVSPNITRTVSGATYFRGGKCVKTFYYLYAVLQNNLSNPALILSTRSVATGDTLIDLPPGYIYYRQLPFALLLDASAKICPFLVASGWPGKTQIYFTNSGYQSSSFSSSSITASLYNLLVNATQTTYTTVNASSLIPKISRQGIYSGFVNGTSPSAPSLWMRDSTNQLTPGNILTISDNSAYTPFYGVLGPCDVNQNFDYKIDPAGGTLYVLTVNGFVVTEVY